MRRPKATWLAIWARNFGRQQTNYQFGLFDGSPNMDLINRSVGTSSQKGIAPCHNLSVMGDLVGGLPTLSLYPISTPYMNVISKDLAQNKAVAGYRYKRGGGVYLLHNIVCFTNESVSEELLFQFTAKRYGIFDSSSFKERNGVNGK